MPVDISDLPAPNDISDLPVPPKATQAAPQSSSFMDTLKNLGSAAVRPVAKAVSSLPLMVMDAGVGARNLIEGRNAQGQYPYELPSTMFNRALDTYTRPPTGAGKVGEFISTALLSSRLPNPEAAQQAPAGFTSQAVRPAPSELTPAQQHAQAVGESIGMRQLPGQATGNKALQQFEAKLESSPWTSGPINAVKAGNQSALNRTAAASIGEKADVLDSSVLSRAADRLGQVFENVRDPARMTIVDPQRTKAALDAIDQDAEGLIDGSIRDNKLVARLENLANTGGINGEQLGKLSSKLGQAAYKQMTSPSGDRDLGRALYAVKDHVDDLVESGLTGEEQAAYGAARQQYRNLMTLTSRVGITNPSTGNVSGAALASKLQQADRSGFLYGRNQSDLYNAARFAQAFKPVVGDSGTATRTLSLGDLMNAHLGIPAHLLSRAYVSRPGQAAVRGALAGYQAVPGLLSNPSPLAAPVIGGLLAAQ
jgi:hypothetical protein